MQPPVYRYPEDYTWVDSHCEGNSELGAYFVIERSLSLKHLGFSCVTPAANDMHGMIRWQSNEQNQNFASHVGMALVGTDRTVCYNANIKLPDEFKIKRMKPEVTSATQSSLVILLQGDGRIPYDSTSSGHAGPLRVTILDRHGNGHNVSIKFASSGSPLEQRTELEVSVTSEIQRSTGSTPEAGTADDSTVANIEFFQVRGRGEEVDNTHCPFYSNGFQQTYVEVVLRAVDIKGEPVQLGDEDTKTLRLVDYDSGASLPVAYQVSLSRSELDLKFAPYPGTKVSELEPAPTQTVVTFWIKSTAEENRQIAAAIDINGTHYHTHQKNLDPGGKTTSGRSNSSAMLAPRGQNYFYNSRDFKLDRNDEVSRKDLDIDFYKISLASEAHRIVHFLVPTGKDHSQVCYVDLENGHYNIIGVWALDEPREVNLSLGYSLSCPKDINTTTGTVNAVRVNAKMKGGKTSSTPLRCEMRDQFGNPHYVTLEGAGPHGSNIIALSDRTAKVAEECMNFITLTVHSSRRPTQSFSFCGKMIETDD
nr:hypothetical protein [uncultured Pseudomonas sp.]